MNKFNVGSRVKVKKQANTLPAGRTGIIREIGSLTIGVEFPGWGGGHRLTDSLDQPDGWNIDIADLKLSELDWDE